MSREDVVNGLEPMVRYTVTIAAVYKDGNERKRVVEYTHGGKRIMWCWSECACYVVCMTYIDYSSPEDIKITENLLESSQATVGWSFPANCNDLSQFRVIVRKADSGEVVDEAVVVAEKRQAQIDSLKPSTKYSVTVAAEYSDGSLKQSSKEHETCGMCTV